MLLAPTTLFKSKLRFLSEKIVNLTETFPLLYLIHPDINHELATKPRVSISKQNLNIFHPKGRSCIPMQQQTQSIQHFAVDTALL